MSRAAGLDRLPRRSGWFGGVATIVALALVGAGIAAAVSATGLAVGIGIGAVLAIAAIIVFHTRASRRSEQVDLFLLSVNAVLGWPERELARRTGRHQTEVRRWVGGLSPIRADVAVWLETLTAFHEMHPAPRPQRCRPERRRTAPR